MCGWRGTTKLPAMKSEDYHPSDYAPWLVVRRVGDEASLALGIGELLTRIWPRTIPLAVLGLLTALGVMAVFQRLADSSFLVALALLAFVMMGPIAAVAAAFGPDAVLEMGSDRVAVDPAPPDRFCEIAILSSSKTTRHSTPDHEDVQVVVARWIKDLVSPTQHPWFQVRQYRVFGWRPER